MSAFEDFYDGIPGDLGLTKSEQTILAAAMTRSVATGEYLTTLLYGNDPNGGPDTPQECIRLFVMRARRKLKPFGIEIKTAWGQGYYLTLADKQRVVSLHCAGLAA